LISRAHLTIIHYYIQLNNGDIIVFFKRGKVMQRNETTLSQRRESLLSTHTVLRNTYLLLSLTLLFSAAAAGFATMTQASFGSSIVAFIFSFILLFATTALRNSGWGILAVFAFTGCMGYSLGPMLNSFIHGYSNGGQLILTALGGTGITFFICSAYVLVTKKELSHWNKFLMIGLVVCIVAMLANIFLKMPAMQLAISTLLTLISTLLILYDTSRIIHNGERNYIMATVSLYLDIQMLFQNLLMLLGAFNNNK
jgi:modulator of FtsH protease